MSTGLLFITATSADHRVINRLPLQWHDWEYASGDRFRLITSRSVGALHGQLDSRAGQRKESMAWRDLVPTHALVAEEENLVDNEWSGASLSEIETFCLALDKWRGVGCCPQWGTGRTFSSVWTRRDSQQQPLQQRTEQTRMTRVVQNTRVLTEREIDWVKDPLEYRPRFNKARVPWYQTYLTWTNVEIGNVGWDEMTTEQGGDGWWVYDTTSAGKYLSEEKKKVGDAEIERLVKEDRAYEKLQTS